MRVRIGIGGPDPDSGRWLVVMEIRKASGEILTEVGPEDYATEGAAWAAAMIMNARVGMLPNAERQGATCRMCDGSGVVEVGTGAPPDRFGVYDSDEIPCPICGDLSSPTQESGIPS